jgi:hypothetical protein
VGRIEQPVDKSIVYKGFEINKKPELSYGFNETASWHRTLGLPDKFFTIPALA